MAYDKKAYQREYAQRPYVKADNRKRNQKYRQTVKGRANQLITTARRRAKRLGLDFNLDTEWFEKKLTYGKCEVTGIKFDFRPSEKRHFNSYAPSIERTDNNKGYVKRNCKIVLWGLNNAKGEMGMKEFKKFINLIWEGMNENTSGF